VYNVVVKFTFAISSPDEFLVSRCRNIFKLYGCLQSWLLSYFPVI